MSDKEKIDLNRLTQKELLLRYIDRQDTLNDLVKEFVEATDKKFIGVYRTQNKVQTALAVLTVRVLLLSAGASALVAVLAFLIKNAIEK